MNEPLSDYLTIDSEDDLTRVVFGIVELVGDGLLDEILATADIELGTAATYSYHAKIDPSADRTPDVLLETDTRTVMVEVKRGRSVNIDQLKDERSDLRRHGNEDATLLLISGHDERPPELDGHGLDDVRWIGWREIAIALRASDFDSLTRSQRELVAMLRSKLKAEGYVPFAGMKESHLDDIAETGSVLRRFYSEINTFNRDLEGRIDSHGLQAKNLWRNGVSQDFHRFPDDWRFVTDHLWIAYGLPGREIKSKQGRYLFVAFCWPGGTLPSIRVGYSFSPGYRREDRTFLIEHVQEIAAFLEASDHRVIRTSWGFDKREEFVDREELHPVLSEEETVSGFDRIQLVAEYGADRLTEAGITDSVASDLLEAHEFVETELQSPD